MIIDITLNTAEYLSHHTVINLPADTVEIKLNKTAFSPGDIILTVDNGTIQKQYQAGDEPVDITKLCTAPGEIKLAAVLAIRGEAVRVWQIESLILKKIPSGIVAIDEITELKGQITSLEERLSQTEAALIELAGLTDI